MAQRVKCLPTTWETWVRSLGQEDPLEKEMATHSSILAWRIPWTEEPGAGYRPRGHKELDMTEQLHFHFHFRFLRGLGESFKIRLSLYSHILTEVVFTLKLLASYLTVRSAFPVVCSVLFVPHQVSVL